MGASAPCCRRRRAAKRKGDWLRRCLSHACTVDDIDTTCDSVRSNGGNITRESGPVKGGSIAIGKYGTGTRWEPVPLLYEAPRCETQGRYFTSNALTGTRSASRNDPAAAFRRSPFMMVS